MVAIKSVNRIATRIAISPLCSWTADRGLVIVMSTFVKVFGWMLLTFGVAFLAMLWRRPRHPARCRRCAHQLVADHDHQHDPVGETCPECGLQLRSRRDVRTSANSPQKQFIGLLICFIGGSLCIGSAYGNSIIKLVLARYKVESTHTFADATVTILSPRWLDDDFEGLVEVSIGGRTVYRSRMLHPSAGEFLLALPTDSGGRDQTTEITHASSGIRSDTGGSGGYSTTYLFSPDADGAFLPVAVLENGSFQAGVWVQPDVTYRYWLTAGVASPVPVLRALACQTGLRFLDPTAADAPSAEQLSALKSSIANTAVEDGFSRDLILAPTLRGFLDLVYAGRATDGWLFFRECYDLGLERLHKSGWAGDLPRSRTAFESMLLAHMGTSPYFGELIRRNGGSIAPPPER